MTKESLASSGPLPGNIRGIIRTDPFLSRLPRLDQCSPVSGGVAHEVYAVRSGDQKYFLKVRGEQFARVPTIASNPADIRNEYRALTVFNGLLPGNFPTVLSYDESRYYMVLSDAMPQGELLEKLFVNGAVPHETLFKAGRTLKRIHDAASKYPHDIRDEGDGFHYEKKLQDRFGFRQNEALDDMVGDLRRTDRQLILGDPAPKNIAVNNGGESFIFFDLEDAHQGNAVFDYGYLLGHVLLHTFPSQENAEKSIEAFTDGYGGSSFSDETVKKIALGIMLYRLGGIIPYPTPTMTEVEKGSVKENIEHLLADQLKNTSWRAIIGYLNHGKITQ